MVAGRAAVNRAEQTETAGTRVAHRPIFHRRTSLLAIVLACALTASCAPDRSLTGNLPRPEKLSMVKSGFTTQNEVRELLGPPSNVGTFNNKVWYYISQTTEDVPMNVPQVRGRNIVIIRFDDNGVVENVQNLDQTAGREIEPVDRTTPSAGHEPNLLRDLFGNIGRVGTDKPGNDDR
jgi:outer membrane protein assembly factor BamE (lipoprotein component of BamABCDE complex)